MLFWLFYTHVKANIGLQVYNKLVRFSIAGVAEAVEAKAAPGLRPAPEHQLERKNYNIAGQQVK